METIHMKTTKLMLGLTVAGIATYLIKRISSTVPESNSDSDVSRPKKHLTNAFAHAKQTVQN